MGRFRHGRPAQLAHGQRPRLVQWALVTGRRHRKSSTNGGRNAIAWNPISNTWSTQPQDARPVGYGGGATLHGVFYVIGGAGASNYYQSYSETSCATPTATPSATACPISFSDVTDPTAYYYTPVYYLACRGVIGGYSDGTFRPITTPRAAN